MIARPASPAWFWTLVGLALCGIYTYGIGSFPVKWEEQRRCLVAMEMIHRGDYVVPHLLGEPYLSKPPMQNWLAVLLSGNDVEQVGTLTIRGLTFLGLAGIALFLWRLGLPGRRDGPHPLPPLIFLSFGTIIQFGWVGEIDVLFCFFATAAVAVFELGRRRESAFVQWVLPQLFVACGVLTKGLAPLFFYPPIALVAWKYRSAVRFSPRAFALGFGLMALPVGAWVVSMALRYPDGSMASRWTEEVTRRAVEQDLLGALKHVLTYPLLLLGILLPWSLYLLVRVGRLRVALLEALRDPYGGLCAAVVLWVGMVFLFVPAMEGRYLIPMLPWAAVLLAQLLWRTAPAPGPSRPGWWIYCGTLAVVWAVMVIRDGSELLGPGPLAALLFLGWLLVACFAIVRVSGSVAPAILALLLPGLLYGVIFRGLYEEREARKTRDFAPTATALAATIDGSEPIVTFRSDMKVVYELARATGRPPQIGHPTQGTYYWLAPDEFDGPPGSARLARSGSYAIWRVDGTIPPTQQNPLGLDPESYRRLHSRAARARRAYRQAPDRSSTIRDLARATAALGHYRAAIALLDRGIEAAPEDPVSYRYRGAYRTLLREFDLAVGDLSRASDLIAGTPDILEPEDTPDKRRTTHASRLEKHLRRLLALLSPGGREPASAEGGSRTTVQWSIAYQLGLAHYLRGDFPRAESALREALRLARCPDDLCASTYWLVVTLRRLDPDLDSGPLLESIQPELPTRRSSAYRELLLMYRGERSLDSLVGAVSAGELDRNALGYGIAVRQLEDGQLDRAKATLQRTLDGGGGGSIDSVAAALELERLRSESPAPTAGTVSGE